MPMVLSASSGCIASIHLGDFACSSRTGAGNDWCGKIARSTMEKKEEDLSICLITGLVIVGTGHTHVGALSGWLVCMLQGNHELPFFSGLLSSHNRRENDESPGRGEYAVIGAERQT